jgi:hypothetical protein
MIPQIDFHAGKCCVCGEQSHLKFVDPELPGWFMGNCCFTSALSADRVLILNGFARPQERVAE